GCTPDMRHIDYGLGAFRKSAFASHPDGEAFDLVTVYQELLANGDLAGFDVPGRFYEIGSPAGLEETRAHLARKGHVIRGAMLGGTSTRRRASAPGSTPPRSSASRCSWPTCARAAAVSSSSASAEAPRTARTR